MANNLLLNRPVLQRFQGKKTVIKRRVLLIFFIVTGLIDFSSVAAQTRGTDLENPLFRVDVRLRYINDESSLRVVVQIENLTGKPVHFLEGFLFVILTDEHGNQQISEERRLTIVQGVDAPLLPAMSISNGLTLPVPDTNQIVDYEFQISKLKFVNDYRVYTYDPGIGLKRID